MKREKFVALAQTRTQNAIKQIQLIGNLANRSSYEYNEQDVKAIFSALSAEIKKSKVKFGSGGDGKTEAGFSLAS